MKCAVAWVEYSSDQYFHEVNFNGLGIAPDVAIVATHNRAWLGVVAILRRASRECHASNAVLRDSRRFDKIGNGEQIAASVSALDDGLDVIS